MFVTIITKEAIWARRSVLWQLVSLLYGHYTTEPWRPRRNQHNINAGLNYDCQAMLRILRILHPAVCLLTLCLSVAVAMSVSLSLSLSLCVQRGQPVVLR